MLGEGKIGVRGDNGGIDLGSASCRSRKVGSNLADGGLESGIRLVKSKQAVVLHGIWVKLLAKWFEDEFALRHPRMGYDEVLEVNLLVIIKQNVQIN